ncbi:O-antigen ligase like membrane protein [Lachnospiraceae bacterium XBD2001]|nr:O-antigen ligase like membrane protein [Lachnospiraceae bacterium XBD2001]
MRIIELPRWKVIKKDVLFALLIWIYIFENITLYMTGSNRMDNLFQVACVSVMLVILLVRKCNGIPIRVDDITVLGFLLIFTATWQDIIRMDMSGLAMAVRLSLPIFMYIFIVNVWYYDSRISKSILYIPMAYGIYSSLQGIILFFAHFLGFYVRSYTKYIPKQDKTYTFFAYGLGGYESWGSILGHNLGRARAMFVEPTRFAAFLMIPLCLFWAYYKKYRKRGYLVCFGIVLLSFILTLSRAGYITLVGAIVVGAFAKMGRSKDSEDNSKATKKDIRKFLIMPIIALIAVEVLLHGMAELSQKYPDASFLSVGLVDEETGKARIFRSETFDFDYCIPKFVERPWGYGLSNVPHRKDYTHDLDTNLSSAMLLWPMAGGVPGLLVMVSLLLVMFFKYCLPVLKSDDPLENAIGLVFVAMAINSLNVGTWLDCDFLLIVAVMVALRRKTIE